MKQTRQFDFYLAAAVLIACVAAWPLLSGGGLLNTRGGGDSPFLLQRLHQLMVSLQDGHFPVRWMPDANYGYGYPFFNYYAPLAFYVASLFKLFGFSYVQAIQLSQLTAFVVAAVGMYRLGLRWFGRPAAAFLTASAYTLAPFHLVNVYVRGDSIAEFWAMAFYPLIILAVDHAVHSNPKQAQGTTSAIHNIVLIGLAYGGLVVSHNISALIFSPFVGLYAIGRWLTFEHDRPELLRTFAQLVGGLILGLMVSAWFWLPAIGEQSLTRLDEVTVGYFNYAYNDGYHFRSSNLVQQSFLFDPDVADGNAFQMGLLQAIFGALGVLALLIWPAVFRRSRWLWLTLLGLSTFMMTPYSIALWNNVPLLPFTQFPWRFLSVQAFWLAPCIGFLAHLSLKRFRFWGDGVAWAGTILLLVAGIGGLTLDFLPVADDEVTAENLAQYEWFTGNIGTTVGGEYLSAAVNPRPFNSRWLATGSRSDASFLAGQGKTSLVDRSATQQVWTITVESDQAELLFPTMYWPGWAAEQDAGKVDITAASGSGLIQLTLPQGTHELTLFLKRTLIRQAAELISLLALGFVAGWMLLQRGVAIAVVNWSSFGLVFGLFALFWLITWIFSPAAPRSQAPATWDFGQLGYLHRQNEILYGNEAILQGYRYSADEVRAGETLEIILNWSQAPAGDIRTVDLQLTTPSTHFFNFVPPVAAAAQPLQAGAVSYQLEISESAPAGLVVPQLVFSDNNRPRTPAAFKRGTLHLAPIRILPNDLELGSDAAELDVRLIHSTQSG